MDLPTEAEPVRVVEGDCLEVLAALPDGIVDAVVSDPPYGLEFMGKEWDSFKTDRRGVSRTTGIPAVPGVRGQWSAGRPQAYDAGRPFQQWCQQWAAAALRVLKPGGYAAVFGGTRTYHRLACAVEDAGFEVRDCLMWVYGTGFPKGTGCLKPAYEPILLCRRPGPKVLPLGVDECRVPAESRPNIVNKPKNGEYAGVFREGSFADGATSLGRWPANVLHDGSDEVMEAFAAFGERAGDRPNRSPRFTRGERFGYSGPAKQDVSTTGYADTGTGARFFASCEPTADEAFIRSAKDMIGAWNQSHAFAVANSSFLPSEAVSIALGHAVSAASLGARRLNGVRGLTTSVTPSELRRLAESVITVTLSIERRCSQGLPPDAGTGTYSLVPCAGVRTHSGIMEITISHWKSDGSAAPATFSITPTNSGHGGPGSEGTLRFNYCAKASKADRGDGNTHPTVKPVALMRWLVRLVCPAGGLVLDPFGGSGTTGVAALAEHRRCLLVERMPEYVAIARRRTARPVNDLFATA